MGAPEIEAFLTHLAQDENVAASTQNQAFNALLFLYRNVLHVVLEAPIHTLRAIVAGGRDPHKLAALRNYRCKKDEEEIAKALTGTLRKHLLRLAGVDLLAEITNL